jgi:hypothetical protein
VFENRALRRNLDRGEMKWQEAGESCIMRSFVTCTLRQYNQNGQVKKDEMGRPCMTNGEKKNLYRLFVRNPKKKNK